MRDAAAAASGGPAAEDIGAPPKHKGLRALSVASRAYHLLTASKFFCLLSLDPLHDPRRHIEDLGEFKVAGDLDVRFKLTQVKSSNPRLPVSHGKLDGLRFIKLHARGSLLASWHCARAARGIPLVPGSAVCCGLVSARFGVCKRPAMIK